MNALRPQRPRTPTTEPSDEAEWPTSVTDLSEPELLVLGAYRHWLTGIENNRPLHFEIVSREFRLALSGEDGSSAFTAFAGMIRILGHGARRTLRFHYPCCRAIALDEGQIVALTAACQQNRLLLARSIAEWIVDEAQVGDLMGRTSMLASLMDRHGLRLPDRIAAHQQLIMSEATYIDRVH
ncbi:MAG: hypothetical protein RIC16_06625 [Rhodospirillales bacterium]